MDSVSKEAREAAANVVATYRDQRNANWQQRIRDGRCDDGEMVQAFARFQEAARLAVVEECAAIVRSVIEYNQVRASEARAHGVDWHHEALIIGVSERMLAAIRALQPKVAGQ